MPEALFPQEILPHPFDPEQRIIPLSIVRAEKLGDDEPVIRFVATDGSEDRHGSRINPNGWDLSAYKRNPVILWGHNQAIPAIGNAQNITLASGRMELDVRFAVDAWEVSNMGNLAQLLFRLASDDVIRAMSTSFIPRQWHEIEATTIPSFFAENVEYDRQEMTENSIVNVPSNRNALKKAVSDHVISENEATMLGLGAMMRFEMPAMVRTEAGVIAPQTAVKRELLDGEEIIMPNADRAGEPITDPPSTSEQQIMASLAESLWSLAQEAMAGFDVAEHDNFRMMCAGIVGDSLSRIDTLKWWLSQWFEVNPETLVTMMASPEFTEARSLAAETRVGAVLNKSNKARLEQIKTLADEVIASADKAGDGEEEKGADGGIGGIDVASLARELSKLFDTAASGIAADRQPKDASDTTAPGSDAPESTPKTSYLFDILAS